MKTRCKDGFAEFVEFLKYAVESANDPVYGKEVLNKKGNRQMAPHRATKAPHPLNLKPTVWSLA